MLLSIRLRARLLQKFYSTTSFKMSTGDDIGVPLGKVVTALENFASVKLSEHWDNTGLLIEPYTARNITKLLLTNDLTEDVALEGKDNGCEMIVSYHPPIFAPLKSVTQGAWKERIVSLLLENRIALYSPHTSWDSVQGGVNDWLASAFTFAESRPIIKGEDPNVGAGRLLSLKTAITLDKAISDVKQLCGLQNVRFAIGKGKALTDHIQAVALCAGSGASVLKGVSAELYLTGEMLHHDVLDAAQKGISVILTNHSDSERGFLSLFASDLSNRLNNEVEVLVSKRDKDPLITI